MRFISETPQALGSRRDYELDLYATEDGSLAGVFDGTEAIAVAIWPGGSYPILATASVAFWLDVASEPPRIALALLPEDIALLASGTYRLRVTITPTGADPIDAFDGLLALVDAPGATPLPRSYCSHADLLDVAPWLDDCEDLRANLPAAGLAARAAATRWLDRQILSRITRDLNIQARRHAPIVRVDPITPTSGWDAGPGSGPSILPDTTLRDQLSELRAALEAGQLMTGATDPDDLDGGSVVRIAAHYALWCMLRNQIGAPRETETTYQMFGKAARLEALRLMLGWTARIDTDADGVANFEVMP